MLSDLPQLLDNIFIASIHDHKVEISYQDPPMWKVLFL